MSSIDLVLMGVQNLWRRKLRTILTILGVLIGTSSIIVMLSLGFGMNRYFEKEMSTWGNLTNITVHKGWSEIPGKKQPELNDKAIESFLQIENVVAVSPNVDTYGLVKTGKFEANLTIKGMTPKSMEAFDFQASEGRLLQDKDKLEVVVGSEVANNFYNPKSRTYQEPNINLMKDRFVLSFENYDSNGQAKKTEYKIKIVGVLEPGDWESNYSMYMNLHELEKIIKNNQASQPGQGNRPKKKEYQQATIKVNDMKNVEAVQKVITDSGYEAYSLNEQLESIKKQTAGIQAMLGGIGAISLLVAAIGITNTMVMSIYERTKEIGVMKVIGASIKDIKRLFLFESALIGVIGGMVGVGFSYILSFVLNKFSYVFGGMIGLYDADKISVIPGWLALAALVFSAIIGLVSGYFPARRAMNLSALEAIKTE